MLSHAAGFAWRRYSAPPARRDQRGVRGFTRYKAVPLQVRSRQLHSYVDMSVRKVGRNGELITPNPFKPGLLSSDNSVAKARKPNAKSHASVNTPTLITFLVIMLSGGTRRMKPVKPRQASHRDSAYQRNTCLSTSSLCTMSSIGISVPNRPLASIKFSQS